MLARRVHLFAATLVLPGCAAVVTVDGERLELTSPEFPAYVERVFREQNRVADELAFALDDVPPRAGLAAAEQALIEACALVNELATARRDQRRLGLRRSAVGARSVPACERATREAEGMLAGP